MIPRQRELFPALKPTQTGLLDVGDGHCIYFEVSGNPDGIPVLIFHGGPGAGSNPQMRRYHDPSVYRIIQFDQRGCGQSRPRASLDANTTWHLIADMEKLRAFLNVDCWQLFGGSWGSTLALIYAQNHQSRVLSLILRGIFLLRMQELEWFYQKGCNWIFPEAYDQLVAPLSAAERNDVISAYYDRLRHPDEAVRARAAKAWSAWEAATMSLNPMRGRTDLFESEQSVLAFARIEAHYFKHAGFMSHDGQVLHQVPRMAHLPGTLVHGRYDVITPLRNALDLAAVWPAANLQIVERAGHAMSEVGITSALLAATRHHQQYATRPDPELGSVGSSAS